jgi:hypothetical protein
MESNSLELTMSTQKMLIPTTGFSDFENKIIWVILIPKLPDEFHTCYLSIIQNKLSTGMTSTVIRE